MLYSLHIGPNKQNQIIALDDYLVSLGKLIGKKQTPNQNFRHQTKIEIMCNIIKSTSQAVEEELRSKSNDFLDYIVLKLQALLLYK